MLDYISYLAICYSQYRNICCKQQMNDYKLKIYYFKDRKFGIKWIINKKSRDNSRYMHKSILSILDILYFNP